MFTVWVFRCALKTRKRRITYIDNNKVHQTVYAVYLCFQHPEPNVLLGNQAQKYGCHFCEQQLPFLQTEHEHRSHHTAHVNTRKHHPMYLQNTTVNTSVINEPRCMGRGSAAQRIKIFTHWLAVDGTPTQPVFSWGCIQVRSTWSPTLDTFRLKLICMTIMAVKTSELVRLLIVSIRVHGHTSATKIIPENHHRFLYLACKITSILSSLPIFFTAACAN